MSYFLFFLIFFPYITTYRELKLAERIGITLEVLSAVHQTRVTIRLTDNHIIHFCLRKFPYCKQRKPFPRHKEKRSSNVQRVTQPREIAYRRNPFQVHSNIQYGQKKLTIECVNPCLESKTYNFISMEIAQF